MPIIFESDKLGVCRTSIQYSLNKCFQSNIQISVNVVRPYLKLRDTQIKMHFDSRHGKNTHKINQSVLRRSHLNSFSKLLFCSAYFSWGSIIFLIMKKGVIIKIKFSALIHLRRSSLIRIELVSNEAIFDICVL